MLTLAEAERAPFILHCLLNSYSLTGGSLPLFNPPMAVIIPLSNRMVVRGSSAHLFAEGLGGEGVGPQPPPHRKWCCSHLHLAPLTLEACAGKREEIPK